MTRSIDLERAPLDRALVVVLAGYLLLSDLIYPQDHFPWFLKVGAYFLNMHHVGFEGLSLVALVILFAGRKFPSLPALCVVSVWMGAWAIGAIVSPQRAEALTALLGFIVRALVPAWAAFAVASKHEGARWLIWLLIATIQICALAGLGEWFLARGPFFAHDLYPSFRIFGTVGHPVPLSALMLLGLPLSFTLQSPEVRAFFFSSVFLCLVGTMTRSSLLLAVLSTVAIAIVLPYRRPVIYRLYGCVGLGGLAALAFWTFLHPLNAHFWLSKTEGRYSGHTLWIELTRSHRIGSYVTTWAMFKARPIWGGGLSTFPARYLLYIRSYAAPDVHTPDNTYLRLLADTGIAGFVSFVAALGFALRELFRKACSRNVQETTFPGGIRETTKKAKEPSTILTSQDEMRLLLAVGIISVLISSCFFDSVFWPAITVPVSISVALAASKWPSPPAGGVLPER